MPSVQGPPVAATPVPFEPCLGGPAPVPCRYHGYLNQFDVIRLGRADGHAYFTILIIRLYRILLCLYDRSVHTHASIAVQVFKETHCCIFEYGLFVRLIDRSWTHGSNAPFLCKTRHSPFLSQTIGESCKGWLLIGRPLYSTCCP